MRIPVTVLSGASPMAAVVAVATEVAPVVRSPAPWRRAVTRPQPADQRQRTAAKRVTAWGTPSA